MYKPTEDRVWIRPVPLDKVTSGGVHIPDNVKQKPTEGTVVAVGPGTYARDTGVHMPVLLKIGDKVLYPAAAPTEFELEGEKYLIIRASDCMMYDDGQTDKKNEA